MQSLLNEEIMRCSIRPILIILVTLIISSGILMFGLNFMCNVDFPCPGYPMQFGIIYGTLVMLFIGLCILGCMISCVWDYFPKCSSKKLDVEPHIVVPPPPLSRYPSHALKSFRESV